MHTGSPNIIFILTDEHTPFVSGFHGNRRAITPNLDRLAANGVAFDGAYCNSPLCAPSRHAFTAVQYASRIGMWGNGCDLAAGTRTLPRAVSEAGYESVLCGKMHFGRNHLYGFREVGEHSIRRSVPSGPDPRRDPDCVPPSKGLPKRFQDIGRHKHSFILDHDRNVTANATRFLQQRRDNRPLFLLAGYRAPHFPLVVPERFWRPFKGKIPPAHASPEHIASLPRNYHHLRAARRIANVPPDTSIYARELYYGLVAWVDHEIGQLLDAIDQHLDPENTIIIYSSDHGENLGEHGLWWKASMYEYAARVPLIVSCPARWPGGQRRTGACSLLDVARTITQIAGVDPSPDWAGDSLIPWLDDPATPWKDLAVSEYYAKDIASGFSMIRTGKWKYVYHTAAGPDHPPQRELYNLKKDPGETTNRAHRPKHANRITELHDLLVREIGEDPEDTEARCRQEYADRHGTPLGP